MMMHFAFFSIAADIILLDRFCDVNPQHPTTQLLEIVFDAFSEALSNAALAGATAQVYSIFVRQFLKDHGMDYDTEAAKAAAMTDEEILALIR